MYITRISYKNTSTHKLVINRTSQRCQGANVM